MYNFFCSTPQLPPSPLSTAPATLHHQAHLSRMKFVRSTRSGSCASLISRSRTARSVSGETYEERRERRRAVWSGPPIQNATPSKLCLSAICIGFPIEKCSEKSNRKLRFSVTFFRTIYLGNCDQVAERHFFQCFILYGAPRPNGTALAAALISLTRNSEQLPASAKWS